MDKIEILLLRQFVAQASDMNYFHWTREMLQAHSKLSEADRNRLGKLGTKLVKYVQLQREPDRPPQFVGDRLRISLLREHSVDMRLAELACLWPLILNRRDKQELRVPAKMSDEMSESAAEWLSSSYECFECYQLLPTALQREWLGKSPATDDVLEMLAILIERPITSPEDDFKIYRDLSEDEGMRLATHAMQLFDSGAIAGQAIAVRILESLACLVPGSLRGCHARLAEMEVFRCGQGVVYRDADSGTSDLLLEMESKVEDYDGWLKALAWIGDSHVREQFDRWRKSSSEKWEGRIHIKPHEYCYGAGWELTREGKRRQLYFDTCYQLILGDEAPNEVIPGPVEVAIQREDHCGQCGFPLTNLFDIDLTEDRMKFLEIRGSRLRIATCTSCWACVYSSFDAEGNASWSSASEESFMKIDAFYPLKPHALILGPRGKTTVESHLAGWQRNAGSWIGGHADWLNDAYYPRCPNCKESMMFFGQIDLCSIGGNGKAYGFLCRDCCMAATTYDCT